MRHYVRRLMCHAVETLSVLFVLLSLVLGFTQLGLAQTGVNPLNIFKNYFVTGDYVVAGWAENSSANGFASGTISVPDTVQAQATGMPSPSVPVGADVVAAYLYWGTVEKAKTAFAGQQAFFNGYPIIGTILGNLNAPVSWSSGGCAGASNGTTTMRTYRADVRQFLPVDTNPSSPTFGALLPNGTFPVRLADSGSNGNTPPNALGATLVIIYRILSPPTPLNAIVLYDGSYAPSNSAQSTSQTIVGFYQPATSPVAKLTHIVANGQPNKSEQVYLNNTSQPLLSLYSGLPPFPGVYGFWDNPTWVLSSKGYVSTSDTSETTSVVPSSSNSGCVSWGAMILSTTVQDSDGDGLLDVWKQNYGYTDAVSGQFVALPGASVNTKDLFIEVDYLSNLDGSAGPLLHSHLPKQAALDAVGNIFASQKPPINVHFDLPSGVYTGDPYVISTGLGGNAISEGTLLCTDGTTLCAFPNQPAIGWKGDFLSVRDSTTLGNFQPGRGLSYHYILFGHSLGAPRSFWSTYGNALGDPTIPQLVSIANSGSTATVTIQSPAGTLKPGDCPNALIPACSDASNGRVTISGAVTAPFMPGTNQQPAPPLNGTYFFNNASSTTNSGITTTTFTITTANVPNATYNFGNEPQLAVTYLGPTSTSGHSDFAGGGDSAITLGLWRADDPSNCQPDPSQPLASGQAYCNDQVGTVLVQTGTLAHELGHTLTLTHGGMYYNDVNNPSLATYELNCKPNFLSVMNYLFQVRGFVDGGFDYSGQTMQPLNETTSPSPSPLPGNPLIPGLSEFVGIGSDSSSQSAAHLTRWYSAPNALDQQLQSSSGGRYARSHCDGTPLTPSDVPAVRVDGTIPFPPYSAPLDWNNDLIVPDSVLSPGVDINYNGVMGDSPFSGFNDWQILNPTPNSAGVALQQISARANAFASSGGGGTVSKGGGTVSKGGGIDDQGGGTVSKGGGTVSKGGGLDQDEDTATSTANAPTGLTCTIAQGSFPGCTGSSGSFLENAKAVPLTWSAPNFGQIRKYDIWRAVGSFPTLQQVSANISLFSKIKTLTGAPPSTTYTDPNVKNGVTYTYFVTDTIKQGAQSGPTNPPLVVTVKF